MKTVSILIPCYNEEESLHILYEELCKLTAGLNTYRWEILFVNDGSKDKTLSIIKEFQANDCRIAYVDLSRNFGKENAMLAGFDYVKGDCVIILDADLQDPPSLIPVMIQHWEEGFDDVYAKREDRGKESKLRYLLSVFFYRILFRMSHIEIPQNVGDFRLLDRKCIDSLMQLRESQRYTKGLFAFIGFRKKEITFKRNDREYGRTSWNFVSLFKLAITGITSFTVAPLTISIYFGFIASFSAFIYMALILFKTLVFGESVQGFPTLVSLILFFGGIQLFFLGVMGEYLGQIFLETKGRPTYIVQHYSNPANDEH